MACSLPLKPSWGTLPAILQALKSGGRRGIIVGGWAGLDRLGHKWIEGKLRAEDVGCNSEEEFEESRKFAIDSVCFVNEAPYLWLFPQCSCVVHHGGVGTAQAALYSFKPAVVVPGIGEAQREIARVTHWLGVGVGFDMMIIDVEGPRLATAIAQSLTKADAAKEIGEKLHKESGVVDAASVIDTFIWSKVKAGFWDAAFKEVHGERPEKA